ncbi:hypothetical protein TSUD_273340 [Trifolium subterraneum]|uniref:RRM domain-containing protein n=1 Tax=Trifolium subterraneum TaxID=3900 RepID=A0A2Z6LNZ7_TRISU|nr:hypothetical protein TSUD_273340 [Trifolium subterraneum]
MPKGKPNSSSVAKQSEPEKQVESDEKVDLEEENDPEEEMEEEVEYEEVEEGEEVEEEEDPEEVEEEEEEEEEEEVEEVEEDDATENHNIDDEEKKKHAELPSLPPHKSEVYLGGIPLDALTEDLKEFCEHIGEVVQVRIMKGKDSSENKGFAFVTYRNVELATKAIEELNNTIFKDMKNISNNCGFAFIDYHNNACAEYSKQNTTKPTFKLGDNSPTVSWADPKNGDSSASSQGMSDVPSHAVMWLVLFQYLGPHRSPPLIPFKTRAGDCLGPVKAVYVKNLPKNVTQEQLKKLFEHHGKITKVVLPPPKSGQEKNRIGFVHFAERSNAMKALKNTERYELNNVYL